MTSAVDMSPAGLQRSRQGIADGLERRAVSARDHQLGKRSRGQPGNRKFTLPRAAPDRAHRSHPLGQRDGNWSGIERNFGYAVARAYAGHTDSGSEIGATATYV